MYFFSFVSHAFQRRSLHDVRYHDVIVYFPEFCKLPVHITRRVIILLCKLLCREFVCMTGSHGNTFLVVKEELHCEN